MHHWSNLIIYSKEEKKKKVRTDKRHVSRLWSRGECDGSIVLAAGGGAAPSGDGAP